MTPDARQAFERLPDRVKRCVRPSLRIRTSPISVDDLRLGQSRVGGIPDLPRDFEWPWFKGLGLSFVAQLDLAELAVQPVVLPLPKQGSLAFFYDSEQRTWGFDPKDRGSALVVYFPGPASSLTRTPIPDGVYETGRFSCSAVNYDLEENLPDPSSLYFDSQLSEEENDLLCAVDDAMRDDAPLHRLGGHANCVQNPMELECQLVTNASRLLASGLYCGDDATGYENVPEKSLAPGALDWRLLLQIDTDDDLGMMWGDCGVLYYWIKEEDLRAERFDKCWVILQCS